MALARGEAAAWATGEGPQTREEVIEAALPPTPPGPPRNGRKPRGKPRR